MRHLLIWFAISFDPSFHYVEVMREHQEVHLSADSCEMARVELLLLAGMRSACRPLEESPERYEARTTARVLLGYRVNGRWVSRWERG